MEKDEKLKIAEFSEEVGRLRKDKTFCSIVNGQLTTIGKMLLELGPEERERFAGLAYKRRAILELCQEMENVVALGLKYRDELSPDFKPVKPYLV